jgi:glycosyltransferase involved in cell wall biosynthesis
MRILYFSKDYSTHDHRFLTAIAAGGHDVFYLRLESSARQVEDRPVPSQVEQVQWAGGRGPFRWRDLPRLVLDLKRVIRRLQPDLVHAGPIQTCAFIAALTGFRPLLTMSWGFDLMEDVHRNRWMERITRYVLRHSTYFTSDAIVTRDKAIAYGMNPDRTVVFPWGVDLEHFAPQKPVTRPPSPAPRPSPHVTLFCNRSWEPRYGVDVLARAFVQVAQQREDVGLILLGGGSQGPAIRQILMSGGVLDRVHFGGQISQTDLPNWYHMADLYISPSHVDGSSVSLMEALACGLPALVSDIPANQEWVSAGVNGWLFRDGDAGALAGKILSAIAQREDWPGIGRAARGSVQERADWNRNVRKLFDAYEQSVILHSRRSI